MTALADLYRNDPFSTKLLLHTIFALDLVYLGLHGELLVHYATKQDRALASLFIARPVDGISILLIAIGALLMGLFLCRRAASLFNSNMNWHALFVWGFHAALTVTFAVQAWSVALIVQDKFSGPPSPIVLSGVWLVLSAACDCSLTTTLFVLLYKRFDGHINWVKSVLSVSIQTAATASVLTLAGASVAFAWPGQLDKGSIVAAFELPLSSLHALSLIVALASRTERTAVVVGSTHAGRAMADFAKRVIHSGGFKDESDAEQEDGWDLTASDEEEEEEEEEGLVAVNGAGHEHVQIELRERCVSGDSFAMDDEAAMRAGETKRVDWADHVESV